MLTVDFSQTNYTAKVLSPAPPKKFPTLAYDGAKFVFLIGGLRDKSVHRYNLLKNVWSSDLPNLPYFRGKTPSSACYINACLFVYGDTVPLHNEIEKLDTSKTSSLKWETIVVDSTVLPIRNAPAMCALNRNEFVIIGGIHQS